MKIFIYAVIFMLGIGVGLFTQSFLIPFIFKYNPSVVAPLVEPSQVLPAVAPATPKKEESNLSTTTPLVIDPARLTDTQKDLLKLLGIDPTKVTLTEAMVSCAYTAVGEGRAAEILAGAKPTPLEIIKVLPCVR